MIVSVSAQAVIEITIMVACNYKDECYVTRFKETTVGEYLSILSNMRLTMYA